jgi:hypothetical protein
MPMMRARDELRDGETTLTGSPHDVLPDHAAVVRRIRACRPTSFVHTKTRKRLCIFAVDIGE